MRIKNVVRHVSPPPPVKEITVTLSSEEARTIAAALASMGRNDMEDGYKFCDFDPSEIRDLWPLTVVLLHYFESALK